MRSGFIPLLLSRTPPWLAPICTDPHRLKTLSECCWDRNQGSSRILEKEINGFNIRLQIVPSLLDHNSKDGSSGEGGREGEDPSVFLQCFD